LNKFYLFFIGNLFVEGLGLRNKKQNITIFNQSDRCLPNDAALMMLFLDLGTPSVLSNS